MTEWLLCKGRLPSHFTVFSDLARLKHHAANHGRDAEVAREEVISDCPSIAVQCAALLHGVFSYV